MIVFFELSKNIALPPDVFFGTLQLSEAAAQVEGCVLAQ